MLDSSSVDKEDDESAMSTSADGRWYPSTLTAHNLEASSGSAGVISACSSAAWDSVLVRGVQNLELDPIMQNQGQ